MVAFKARALGEIGVARLVAAVALVAYVPLAHEADAVVSVGVVAAVVWALLTFEVRYADARDRARHEGFRVGEPLATGGHTAVSRRRR